MDISSILRHLVYSVVILVFFPVLVCCANKNLATLVVPASTLAKSRNIRIRSQARSWQLRPGLPDFSWYFIPKLENMYQMNTKCTK
jgi:hypothetical protein